MAVTLTQTAAPPQENAIHQSGKSQSRYLLRAENAPQSHTMMAYPSLASADNEDHLKLMQDEIVTIANTIARFQPVHLFTRANLIDQAKALVGSNVFVKEACADQLWIRDSGPIYVHDAQKDSRTAVNFNFNYWGNKLPKTGDENLAQNIINQSKGISTKSQLTLEGGAVEHDGEGTFLATESSIINDNRNPGKSKAEIERELSAIFGVTHFIWLPGIKDYDITDFHIDAFARFAEPGVVILSKPDPTTPAVVHKAYEEALSIFENTRDAKGRRLTIHICEEPDLTMIGSHQDDNETVASYANYLLVNGAVILPKFGQDKQDRQAFELFKTLFSGREVVQVPINVLPRTGGGIHCATQHVPV